MIRLVFSSGGVAFSSVISGSCGTVVFSSGGVAFSSVIGGCSTVLF